MRPTQTPMFTTQQPFSHRPLVRRQTTARRGQSIVVALLVLLLLGLTGALFVTIIARNLINARHGVRVQTADTYAAAGINYADAQLSSSIDGADWRPPLQFALAANYVPTTMRETARYNASLYNAVTNPTGLQAANANDPDLEYLQAGYTRYNTGAGRYLIRVTYDPVNVNNAAGGAPSTVPPGKYLKVESIGREGVIDPIDPTTYSNNRSSDRLQADLVAYVPIGITDYARFETNPDKRSDIANLGVVSEFYADNTDGGIATPGVFDFNSTGSTSANGTTPPTIQEYPVLTTYGAVDAYKTSGASYVPNPNSGTAATTASGFAAGGGSIHANMPVRFFGTNVMYLNNVGASAPLFQDSVEIAGDLLLDNYANANPLKTTSASATAGQQAALILNPMDLANPSTGTYVAPSNSSGLNGSFNTQGGLVRDGSMQNDSAGLPRSITRLEPPLMDATDSASQIPRYRAIAMNSAPRTFNNNAASIYPAGSGQYGYGKDIYINNPADVQPDSASIGGGSTLTDEWLHGNTHPGAADAKGGWQGLFYNPPGVSITLGQYLAPAPNTSSPEVYGIRLASSTGETFPTPAGGTSSTTQMDVSYSDLDRSNGVDRDSTDPSGANSDKDIIIYAEGNVRVRGVLSPDEGTAAQKSATPRKATTIPRHITIVTNGTAYIEGNLLKGDPDSTISVLAHDYVCVNTTQFLAGTNVEQHADGSQNPTPSDSTNLLTLDDTYSLLQEFNFGLPNGGMPAGPLSLYVSAGPGGGGSGSSTKADFDILDPVTQLGIAGGPLTAQTYSTITRAVYPLANYTSLASSLATDVFDLSIKKDAGTDISANGTVITPQDVALERAAILPMDIRIEAVLYAQTRSFFVIPGEWFDTSSSDNLTAYLSSFTNNPATFGRPANTDDRFPLYGQPIDLKITIDGTVSEARPADIAAQTSWMLKWGWIPQYHGSYNIPMPSTPPPGNAPEVEGASPMLANQPAVGLQIIYDPQAGYPYNPGGTTNGTTVVAHYLRSDLFGRPLPFTPKLPVSTGLLYSGQSGEQPLLQ